MENNQNYSNLNKHILQTVHVLHYQYIHLYLLDAQNVRHPARNLPELRVEEERRRDFQWAPKGAPRPINSSSLILGGRTFWNSHFVKQCSLLVMAFCSWWTGLIKIAWKQKNHRWKWFAPGFWPTSRYLDILGMEGWLFSYWRRCQSLFWWTAIYARHSDGCAELTAMVQYRNPLGIRCWRACSRALVCRLCLWKNDEGKECLWTSPTTCMLHPGHWG